MAAARAPRGRAPRAPRAPRAARAVNPLLDPSATLSGTPLRQAAAAMTNAVYNPQIAALNQQQVTQDRQGRQLMGNAGDYYRQLAAQEAQGVAREGAIGQLLQQQQGNVGAATQGAFSGMAQQEAARQAQDAAVRGGGLQGSGPDQVAAAITGGQTRSALLQQAAQNASAEQGGNWAALANANLQARQVRGGEIQGQLANRIANADAASQGKIGALQANRANDLAKNIVTLRQQGFTNAATLSGLGLKASDLQFQQAKANQTNATANRRINVSASTADKNRTAAGQRSQASIQAANQRAAAKTAAQQTATQQKHLSSVRSAAGKAWAQVDDTLAKMGSAQVPRDPTNPTGPTRPASTNETLGALRAKKVPEWAIQAALSIRHNGYITPNVVAMIHRDAPAVRIPGRYRQPAGSGRLANFPT